MTKNDSELRTHLLIELVRKSHHYAFDIKTYFDVKGSGSRSLAGAQGGKVDSRQSDLHLLS